MIPRDLTPLGVLRAWCSTLLDAAEAASQHAPPESDTVWAARMEALQRALDAYAMALETTRTVYAAGLAAAVEGERW